MLTSETDHEIVAAARSLGVSAYLNKPLQTAELVKVLARMMVKAAAL
jgi:AmiR/NasT family two-component response regulator